MSIILENSWTAEPLPFGTLHLRLTNLSEEKLENFTLSLTTITRVLPENFIEGGVFLHRNANYHQFAMPEGKSLNPGETWSFSIEGLHRKPLHRNDAVKSAWVTRKGIHTPVEVGDLTLEQEIPRLPPPRLPEGRLTAPFALLPWPNQIEADAGPAPVILHAAPGTSPQDLRLMLGVGALHSRLWPQKRKLFQIGKTAGSRALAFAKDDSLPAEGYRIDFSDEITLSASSESGRRYGLISLAQMLNGAFSDPKFLFPNKGFIQDAPRYDWRASHLDCARQFWRFEEVKRFIDILAWQKFNVFHWHLTDDEAWRAEIKAYPQLTEIGAYRGADIPEMLPQLGNGPARQGGYYSQDEMRAMVAHAASLGVEIMPEIETPGHAACVVASLPFLVDKDETPDSYFTVQGYPNNSWNPAMPQTYEVLEKIIDELCEIFPSRYFHIGGDEVAKNAWLESPQARIVMQYEGLSGTFELQSWFLTKIKAMLTARGKVLVGWNEVAHGGGVPPEDTLLMAWETSEVGIELASMGYDVIMTPGQAYYLDMVQGADFLENGASWAGVVPPEITYTYEAAGDFPEALFHHMRGVQACIWCEHYTSVAWFNDLVFPRLCAIAEAGWTEKSNKDWLRFVAQVKLHPTL